MCIRDRHNTLLLINQFQSLYVCLKSYACIICPLNTCHALNYKPNDNKVSTGRSPKYGITELPVEGVVDSHCFEGVNLQVGLGNGAS